MTAFTVNGGATTEWDALTGGSVNATLDTYAISNNTTLRIACDTYQCANHSAAFGSLDTVTYSGIGGRVLLDGTQVRVIPFTGGSGTVPAIGTGIVQGGVSGPLLGVWANWQSEPLAAGAAMPATGFIKIKSKSGGNYAAGTLTGITATAGGPDVVGWIEVRGADTAAITVSRIGKFEVIGDWFEIGTTNGARGQVLPGPTTATVAGVWPGVWIETAAGSGIYERFVGAGSIVANATIPTDERGKIIWQTTAGLRIGNDGTNGVGYLPPTGCKVRIPNVIMTCCTRTAGGSGARVIPSATLTTRQEFITTSAGAVDFSNAVCQWYANFAQAFSVKVRNSAFSGTLVQSEIASALDMDNFIIAPTQAQLNFGLNLVSNFAGGLIANGRVARFSLAASGAYVNVMNYCKDVLFNNVTSQTLLTRGNATTGTWTCTQNVDCEWIGCTNIGGRSYHVGAQRPKFTSSKYADQFSSATTATLPQYAFDFGIGVVGPVVDGITFVATNTHPYAGIASASACYDITVRNIGTAISPRDFGSANACGVIFNGAGNNDGIRLQRCFAVNTRLGPYAFVNSDNGVVLDQVKGDYADTSVIAALNCTARGVSLVAATTGQVSVYGTHWVDHFTSATVGKIVILANEPTLDSAAQCAVTAGTPRFNSAGQVALTAIGDQVTWEMPYFAKGHTALANLAPTNTGTNPTNLTYEFQYDKGAGYNGTWLTLNAANLTGAGAVDPAIGVKLKVRATCATANAGNLLTQIAIPTVTSTVAQNANLYPLDEITLTLTGVQPGSDIVILNAGTETERINIDANPDTDFAYDYESTGNVDIKVYKAGYVPFAITNYPLSLTNAVLPVAQVADRNYLN